MKLRALALIFAALGLTEGALRLTGRGPWHPFESFADAPTISQPDPTIGWINAPGVFVWPSEKNEAPTTIYTDGVRTAFPESGSHRTLFFGCSFLFGFGLADADTFSAHLTNRRPDLRVENRAVPGYSTHQAALLAERTEVAEATVIYGLVELHEGRNTGTSSWLRALERSATGQAWVALPTSHWNGSALIDLPPTSYTHWSWSEHVALIDAVERARNHIADRFHRTKAETTVQLIVRFQDQVQARGGRFRVALLDLPTRGAFYERRLAEEGIATIDLRPAFRGAQPDGHPNANTHQAWSEALAEAL